eukprot:6273005-Pyramimonas_sp.AAC.1
MGPFQPRAQPSFVSSTSRHCALFCRFTGFSSEATLAADRFPGVGVLTSGGSSPRTMNSSAHLAVLSTVRVDIRFIQLHCNIIVRCGNYIFWLAVLSSRWTGRHRESCFGSSWPDRAPSFLADRRGATPPRFGALLPQAHPGDMGECEVEGRARLDVRR